MTATIATKSDLALLRADLSQLHERLSHVDKDIDRRLNLLRSSLIIWLGSSQIVVAGLLFTALQVTPR